MKRFITMKKPTISAGTKKATAMPTPDASAHAWKASTHAAGEDAEDGEHRR